jgi:HTH-type transcriptional regulator, sugar sensing transcriptional regulator
MTKNQLIQLLKRLGFDDKEAKLYLALLNLGEATVLEVAAKAGLKRPTAYLILDSLHKKGAAFKTHAGGKTQFIPEKPEKLLKRLQETSEVFGRHLGDFEAFAHESMRRPRLIFFDGPEGFKKVWQLIFDSGITEYLIITDPQEMLGFVRKGYITGKIIREKTKRGIKSRQLITFSEYAKEILIKDKQENRISKVLPHTYHAPFTTIIFGDSVAFISPSGENMMLVFESKAFAKTQRSLFEALWEMLPNRV